MKYITQSNCKEFKEQIKSIKGYTIKEKNNVLVVGFNKLELIKLFDSEDGTVLQIADNNTPLAKSILQNCNIIEYIPDKSLKEFKGKGESFEFVEYGIEFKLVR